MAQGLTIPWRFFDALRDTDPCAVDSDPARQMLRMGRTLRPAEVRTFKSHYSVLQAFDTNTDLRWLLVLEDDVIVDPAFNVRGAADLADELGIHRLHLYAMHWQPALRVCDWGSRQIVRYLTTPYGCQVYLISRTGADLFRRSIQSIDVPIDDEHGRLWANGLDLNCVLPFPLIEREIPSTAFAAGESRAGTSDSPAHLWYRATEKSRKIAANVKYRLRRALGLAAGAGHRQPSPNRRSGLTAP